MTLLTDPFLQLPTEDSVRVVWFTEFAGSEHYVLYGEGLRQRAQAETEKMSRLAEDGESRIGAQVEDEGVYQAYTPREVWRHEATVTGLSRERRVPYTVTSVTDGAEVTSGEFTLGPLPVSGQPLKILLTSDHQLKEMTPANLQKVEETVGRVDAVFFAGDLVNIPDRASEWFDDNRGFAFFPSLQGRASYPLERTREDGTVAKTTYKGGELIQHAPLFPVIGNHEVMGRFSPGTSLGDQFNDPHPRTVARERYRQNAGLYNPQEDPEVRRRWLLDNSFNTLTYEELFTLPEDGSGGEQYYAVQFGDVYLIGLYATRIWRSPSLDSDVRGKYREALGSLGSPNTWGYGDFIFEDLAKGSEQYAWLAAQLKSDAFRNAPYKVVLLHQAAHGVGDNYNPVFSHPVQILDRHEDGSLAAVRYEYPLADDIIVRDVQPLLGEAGVQLAHSGHSHLWFRMIAGGVNYLESSNVGNNYGCYLEGYAERSNVPDDPRYNAENYVAVGDPHGLEPVMPSVTSPQLDEAGNPLPCIASNDLTAFSILDTQSATVKSYVFDTRKPNSEVRLFDEFALISAETVRKNE